VRNSHWGDAACWSHVLSLFWKTAVRIMVVLTYFRKSKGFYELAR